MTTELCQKVQGSLVGTAIGDAVGMPVETLSQDKIREETGGRGVTGFSKPTQTNIPDTANMKVGDTTDDTQLTLVVAKSLICSGGWDRKDCVEEHIREYEQKMFGWGGTTADAIKEIMEGKRSISDQWRAECAPNTGCGNGVIMKVAPLALFEAVRQKQPSTIRLAELCMDLGSITHPDPRASFAAYAVALMTGIVMHHPITLPEQGLALLQRTVAAVIMLEQKYAGFRPNPDKVSDRLLRIPFVLDDPKAVRQELGCSFRALDTVAFTLATFIRHPTDFRFSVLEAVNAGGDTDTNASIVGAMVGANVGLKNIPEQWFNFRKEYREIADIGEQLYDVACHAK